MKRFAFAICFFWASSAVAPAFSDSSNWFDGYQEVNKFAKKNDIHSAATSFYRAQLASSWARQIRPSAFVGNGNDPGTVRAALNQTLGAQINPWAFYDPKNRLLPILDALEKEVNAIKTQKMLAESIYSGLHTPKERKKELAESLSKYPFVIPPEERLARFKTYALDWINNGRNAAKESAQKK